MPRLGSWIESFPEGIYVKPADAWVDPSEAKARALVTARDALGLVPGDTPFENLTKDPPPGIGPYKITESIPNRQFVLEKNYRFNLPGIPKQSGEADRHANQAFVYGDYFRTMGIPIVSK